MEKKEERRLLTPENFRAPATELAPALIGKLLCRELETRGVPFRKLEFPRYGEESSALLRLYLNGAFGTDPAPAMRTGAGRHALKCCTAGADAPMCIFATGFTIC